jgi:SAM-dependent methyltransferase
MAEESICRSCGARGLAVFYEVPGVPVHSVLRMSTRKQARQYPTGDIRLAFCPRCAFVANVAFEADRLEYSPRYEETQSFSARFNTFHEHLAKRLIERYDLRDKQVIEIGCGKGEFLTLLCELGTNRGLGFDPSYAGERRPSPARDRLTFVPEFYSERHAHRAADLVCCKMTLEHIPNAGEFISMLRRTLGDRTDTVVFVQVPNFTRILRDAAFWDIYYEHCSYFTRASLEYLFLRSGFAVLDLWDDYDEQYLMIEARPGTTTDAPHTQAADAVRAVQHDVARFAERCRQQRHRWTGALRTLQAAQRRVVVWGAGSKAVAFLSAVDVDGTVLYAVDINPHKHGTFLPGRGQEIVSPRFLEVYRPDAVIVMNPIYRAEVAQELREMRLRPEILTL